MSDTAPLSLPEAARQLGTSLRALRHAIRAGAIPAPPHLTATAPVSAEWLAQAQSAVEASPQALRTASRQAVPPFARYKGTSAWHQFRRRRHAFAQHRAATGAA